MMTSFDREATMMALKRALPYIRLFSGRTFVIKVGGAICADHEALRELATQLGLLLAVGIRVVFVHGGGPQTTTLSDKLGLATTIIDGRRVTSDKTLEVAIMTLNGSVNTAIVAACRAADVRAMGVSGVDAGFIKARRRPVQVKEKNGERVEIDYGLVGDIVDIDTSVLDSLLNAGIIPVVSPLSSDESGQILNINADTVASMIARAMRAEKLIFLTDTQGLLANAKDPGSLVSYTDLEGIAGLEAKGVIETGMMPKVKAAVDALKGGVGRVHMVGYRSLLVEIFTNEGAGTLIVRSSAELSAAEKTGPGGSAVLPAAVPAIP